MITTDTEGTRVHALLIEVLPEGGYTVTEPGYEFGMNIRLFASSTVTEALCFVKRKFEPVPAQRRQPRTRR